MPLGKKIIRRFHYAASRTGMVAALAGAILSAALAGGCPGRVITDGCPSDQDCDDGDPCTDDDCSDGLCASTPIPDCCVSDSECDDDDPCTLDVCVEDNRCATFDISNCCRIEADCEEGEVCDDNDCVPPCTGDGDCPGDEVCDPHSGICEAANSCVDDGDCEEGLVCDTQRGECVDEVQSCLVDGDCDDGDPCTVESCEGGECSFGAACDDGLSCTDDSCDRVSEECAYLSNCPIGEQCDAATDQCEPAPECSFNEDCVDDGLFCTGAEFCGGEGFCGSSGNPCAAGLICNESADACETPVADCIEFTTAIETKNGTGGDDSFCATWSSATGTPTLQTGDIGNGAAGSDSLQASFQFAAPTTIQPTLSGIETISVTNTGTALATLNATAMSGVSTIRLLASTNPAGLVFASLANVVDVAMVESQSGLTLQFQAGATAGTGVSANSMDVELSNVSGGALELATAANGIESLMVRSMGSGNLLEGMVQNGGTTLAQVVFSGTAPLTIVDPLPSTVGNISGTSAIGGISLDVSANTGNIVITCGAGDDTIQFGGQYANGDAVAGGGGVNTLKMTSASANVAVNQTSVTGFSVLTVTDVLANAVNTTRFGAITTLNIPLGVATASNVTVGTGTTINLGTTDSATDSIQPLTITGGTGTSDSAGVVLRDHDTVAIAFSGIEVASLQSANRGDGTAADDGLNLISGAVTVSPTSGAGTLNLSGTANLTITGAVTAGTLNAGSFTGAFIMEATSPAPISIVSGSGNDTLFGSASADSLNAGGGTNIINGRSGVDTIGPLGTGVDTIRLNIAGFAGADRKIISGFSAGVGGDVIQVSAAQLETLSGTDDFASSASMQTHASAGAVTVQATTEVLRITSGTVTNFSAADSMNGTNLLDATGDPDDSITVPMAGYYLFLVGDGSGNTGVYFADSGGDTEVSAFDLTLVAVLQATPIASLDFSNFSNVN